MLEAVESAIFKQKQQQLRHCLHDTARVVAGLETIISSGHQALKVRQELDLRREVLDRLKGGAEAFKCRREAEIRLRLESARESHLQGLLKRKVAHESETITTEAAWEVVVSDIAKAIRPMLQHDLQASMLHSEAHAQLVREASAEILNSPLYYRQPGQQSLSLTTISAFISSMAKALALIASSVFPLNIVGGMVEWGVLRIFGGAPSNDHLSTINASFKKKVFDVVYTTCIQKSRQYASRELDLLMEFLETAIVADEEIHAIFDQTQGGLNVPICEKIHQDLELIMKRIEVMRGEEDGHWEVIG